MQVQVSGLKKKFVRVKKTGNLFERLIQSQAVREEIWAVKDLKFSIEEGETVALIGPNGAGKSTTMKMLTGILFPTDGEASVLGMTPWKHRKQLAFSIGAVFGQKSQLWLHLPAMDTFELLSKVYELDSLEFRKRRDELIERFEVKDYVDVPVRKLSLGQRMRLEIAASLLHRPKILFLDEPTIGLDPVAKASIRELIRESNRDEKTTVLLTSHDAGDIEKLCARTMIVNFGQVVFDGSTQHLKRQFLSEREIDLKLSVATAAAPDMAGVKLVKEKGFGRKFSVDTKVASLDKVVAELLKTYEIEDIGISAPPLEDVIAQIYREGLNP